MEAQQQVTEAQRKSTTYSGAGSYLLAGQAIWETCDRVVAFTKENRHLILRTNWVYGIHGKSNFVETIVTPQRTPLSAACPGKPTPYSSQRLVLRNPSL